MTALMDDDVSVDELREAVQHMHGVPAKFIEAVEVDERFNGEVAVKSSRSPGTPAAPHGPTPPDGDVRTKVFALRFTEAEYAELVAAATRAGEQKVADWARRMLFDNARATAGIVF